MCPLLECSLRELRKTRRDPGRVAPTLSRRSGARAAHHHSAHEGWDAVHVAAEITRVAFACQGKRITTEENEFRISNEELRITPARLAFSFFIRNSKLEIHQPRAFRLDY